MAITMLCSLMVVNASAANTYETDSFSIDMEVDGEWELEESGEEYNGYTYDYYNFHTQKYGTGIEVFVFENADMDLFDEMSENMGGDENAVIETTIDGAIANYSSEYSLQTASDEYHFWGFYANIYKDGTFYRIEMGTNAIMGHTVYSDEEIALAKAQHESAVNSIMEMKLFKKAAPTESDKEDASNSNNEEKTESDKSDNTVIIVAIVVGGVVILGVTAMIIFGKKKKQ